MKIKVLVLSALIAVNAVSGFAEGDASKYEAVKDHLKKIAAEYPDRAKPFKLGLSDSGDYIEGLKIGDGPVRDLIVATHHGNEYGSTEVAKAMASSLAVDPIKGRAVYVIPVLNISGYNSVRRNETAAGRSVDPNRDYPGPCTTGSPFRLKSTKALADFIEKENIVASATLHTYMPAVLYPWGISTQDTATPYDDIFIQLSQAAVVESNYKYGNSTQMLYPADGTFEDYAYWKTGAWSLLFEVGYTHSPNSDAVAELVRVNVPGLRRFIEQSPRERAERHAFTGKCDRSMKALDRHDE